MTSEASKNRGYIQLGAGPLARQVLIGALLMVMFRILHAVTDYAVFGERPFSRLLIEVGSHEIADFTVVLFLVSCLLWYSRRAHRVRAALESELQTALRKAEDEKAKLEGIVEAMGDAISIQAPDLTVVYQNSAHQALAGAHVGRHCYEAYRDRSEVCPECHLVEAFKDGKVHRVELSPPAVPRNVEIISSVLNGRDGRPALGIEVVRDISARKMAEQEAAALNAALTRQAQELQQANRELEAFCQAISPDMRAPLTRVYSSAQELLGYRDLLDENGKFFVNLAHDGCVQMEALLDSLMVLCRVTEMDIVTEPVDLSGLAREIACELRQAQPQRQVSFTAPPQLLVEGDPALLRVVLENLLSNAWKYTSGVADPAVEIGTLAPEEGGTVVFVRDNGAGFDSSRSDQLFQPFKRLHTYRQFPGTGLGLATVRRIIRRHHGRVWGEGSPGRGATFYFTLNG